MSVVVSATVLPGKSKYALLPMNNGIKLSLAVDPTNAFFPLFVTSPTRLKYIYKCTTSKLVPLPLALLFVPTRIMSLKSPWFPSVPTSSFLLGHQKVSRSYLHSAIEAFSSGVWTLTLVEWLVVGRVGE